MQALPHGAADDLVDLVLQPSRHVFQRLVGGLARDVVQEPHEALIFEQLNRLLKLGEVFRAHLLPAGL